MDTQTFLTNLRKTGLVSGDALDAALRQIAPRDHGRSVARGLVRQGVLTKFQATQILAGRTNGFVMGQYRIVDEIGKGGMGRVFKAEHTTMGRTVALKVLASQHTRTEKARRLFMREVRAAGKLMHPNIITAHDANEIDGRLYLVMEYIDGPNLEQLVREQGPLPVGLACDIVRQVGAGLQCAHELGMVHRDIKPSNVLLQRTGTALSLGYLVKIVDFGLARLGDGAEKSHGTIITGKNIIMGTPDYLSPEQARNLHHVDIRSDLYSLGCTFYFLLTGQVPFPGGTTVDKLIRQTREEPTPVEQLRPELPNDVADIVHCLMAKKPANRYQTPAELVLQLVPHAATLPGSWAPARSPLPAGPETVSAATTGSSSAVTEDRTPSDRHSVLSDLLPTERMLLSANDVQLISGGSWPGWLLPTLAGAVCGGVCGAALTALAILLR
jgi:serine/threonine protein kinase